MRRAFLGSIAVCLASAGGSLAQPWGPPPSPPPGMASIAAAQAATSAPPPAAATTPAPAGTAGCASCGSSGMICWPDWPLPQMPCRDEGYNLYAWASIEQLVWWLKDSPLSVPLVTSIDLAFEDLPVLTNPNTVILYGGRDIDYDTAYGLKLACGVFDPKLNLGLEGSVFRIEDQVARFSDHEDVGGTRLLGIPYLDIDEGGQSAFLLAFPVDTHYGGVNITTSNRFWGAEGNVSTTIYSNDGWVIDLIGGFRYFDLKESLRISTARFPTPAGSLFFEGNFVTNGAVLTRDDFDTQNRFYGGQIGFRTETYLGRFFGNFKALCAVGANHQYVSIRGLTTLVNESGQVIGQNAGGGLLAQPANSVRISQDTATVIPIFEVMVGCDITSWLRAYAGYTFIYWGNVTRPGDQIQPVIDLRTVPSTLSYVPGFRGEVPRNPFDRSDFWAQGLSFGLAVRF